MRSQKKVNVEIQTRELFMLMCVCKHAQHAQLSRTESTERTIDPPDSQPSPSSTTRGRTAVDTTKATTSGTKHSAGNTFRNAGPGASKNVGAQFPSATVSFHS